MEGWRQFFADKIWCGREGAKVVKNLNQNCLNLEEKLLIKIKHLVKTLGPDNNRSRLEKVKRDQKLFSVSPRGRTVSVALL